MSAATVLHIVSLTGDVAEDWIVETMIQRAERAETAIKRYGRYFGGGYGMPGVRLPNEMEIAETVVKGAMAGPWAWVAGKVLPMTKRQSQDLESRLDRGLAKADKSHKKILNRHVWTHADGTTEHSATGPLGCVPCAAMRRRARGGK